MPKQGEIDYLATAGGDCATLALRKPFSDAQCGRYLMDVGLILSLLPPPPARVLDLGVGSGWTSTFFAKRGYAVVGQDIAATMIDLAEQNRAEAGPVDLAFVVSDYETLPFAGEFDAAVFYDALHHAEDEAAALAGAYRALKPGGVCVTVEPGEGHHDAPSSREAVERFGVTEKDMPPHHVLAVGRRVGFRSGRVYARYWEPQLLHDPAHVPPPPPPPPGRVRVCLSHLKRAAVGLVRPPAPPPAPDSLPRCLRDSNIVVLRK
jgi:SAM-dependent methyltransferase